MLHILYSPNKMAEGLITDCRLLLSRFENHKSVRFETFCEIWREMNFSLIHCGGRDTNRKIQLVDYLFRIISTYLDSTPCSFPYRIGALYAMYAVYHTQLNRPKVKIRMTLSMMKDLKELHGQIIEQQHHDADYILRLLHKEKAFLFVAMPIPLAYGSKEAITSQEEGKSSVELLSFSPVMPFSLKFQSNVIFELLPSFSSQSLDDAHKNYTQMKAKLLAAETIPNDRSYRAISDSLVTDISSELQKFDEWKRTRCQKYVLERKTGTSLSLPNTSNAGPISNPVAPDTETSTASTSSVVMENAAKSSRIAEIKKRSFSSVSKVSKSMRHLQPSKDSSDQENRSKKKRKK
ncbi:PREDICTED: snRNA-activating protein complex subunit 1-like [Acropora digitifera]|uniref:snRNA-activating protein complex subunit 1-like n=1 Tax=Acropora digitifera TaxID=70779 RepID=UPI00077A7121|nr:PREDICTED: snRNA-activating protein complex subunit 1-like [Acropora digitifera]